MLTQAALVFHTLRVSAPTVVDSLTGRVDRAKVDRRLASWGRWTTRHADLRVEVIGREAVDWSRAYVIMSNHQSYMDVPAVVVAVPGSLRFVAKKELFRIPVFGPAMRAAGMIEVDRGNRQRAIESLKEAAEEIASGVCIWIAPEGTRSLDGRLGPLKKGGFALAQDTGAPILPLAIVGTREAWRPGEFRIRRGVAVKAVFGRAIDTRERPRSELMAEVETFLRRQLDQASA